MRPGKLDSRVILQTRTTTRNSSGDPVESYSTAATVWADVQELSGRELERVSRMYAEVTTQVTIRHSDTVAALDSKSRILIRGVAHDVIAWRDEPAGRPTHRVAMTRREAD